MIAAFKEIFDYRELLLILSWKSIAVRYKQAYLGIAWAKITRRSSKLLLVYQTS